MFAAAAGDPRRTTVSGSRSTSRTCPAAAATSPWAQPRAPRRTATRSSPPPATSSPNQPLSENPLRSLQGLRADLADVLVAACAGGASFDSGAKRQRTGRAGEGSPGNTATPRPAAARPRIWPANCSSSPSASTSPTCRSTAAARPRASTLGGHVPIAVSALPTAVTYIRGGQLRALGMFSSKRSSALPDVPTMLEATGHDLRPTSS